MKKVKSVLALLLSICMVFTCLAATAVWAAEETADTAEAVEITETAETEQEPTTSEAIRKLEALGIWSDGYVESAELSRGDLAVVLAGLLGYHNNEITAEPAFTDVQPGDNCYSAVMFLYGLGVFSPADDGLFNPEDKPTYEQLIKIMAELTGYGVLAQVNGGFPAGYLSVANQYDILPSSFLREPKDVYTLADIAEVIAYVIDVPIMEQNSFGDEEQYSINEDKTLLAMYHNLYLDEGVLTSIQGRRLYASVAGSNNRASIDDREYFIGDVIPAPELLGYAVKAYYRSDGRSVDDATLVYIEKDTRRNRDYTIEGDLITNYSDGTVTYYKTESAKGTSTLSLQSVSSVLYNYNYTDSYQDEDIIRADRLILVDSDNNGSYDVLNIVYYETIFVKNVDASSKKVYDMYGTPFIDLDINDSYKTVDVFDGNMQKVDMAAIPAKSVLSVLRDQEAQHITVYISSLTQKGKITSVTNGDNPEELAYTIEGVEYRLANNYDKVDFIGDVRVGDYVNLYLTREGKVGGLEKLKAAGDYFYGYLSGVANIEGAFEGTYELLLYNDMGELLKLPLASEVRITGEGKVKSEKVPEMLRANSSYPGSLKQLIKYRVDGEGVIQEISLANRVSEKQILNDSSSFNQYISLQNANYNKEYRMFFGKLRLNENTKIFMVPVSAKYAQEIDHYELLDIMEFESGRYNIESYDVKPDRTVGALVVRSDYGMGNEMKSNSAVSVVKEIATSVNEKGDIVTRLVVLRNGSELEFDLADTCSLVQYYRTPNGNVPCEVKEGDIIRFATDAQDNITEWYKLFSINDEDRASEIIRGNEVVGRENVNYRGSGKTLLEFRGNAENPESDVIVGRVWQGAQNQYYYPGVNFLAQVGIVEEKINNVMYIKTYGGTEGDQKNEQLTYMKPGHIVVIDQQENEIRKGDINDIQAAKDDGFDNASRVVIVKFQEQPSLIAVIKR